jgi:hypothetical protein
MSVSRSGADGRARRLSHDEFMAKHASELMGNDSDSVGRQAVPAGQLMQGNAPGSVYEPLKLPIATLMVQLKRWWLVRLLQAAVKENSPEAYSSLLRFWLHELGLDPPAGVFLPTSGTPGRPRSAKTNEIFLTWIDLDKPLLSSRKLAHAIYKQEFTKANSDERKKMIDRCRRTVERRIAQLRLNSPSD